MPYSQPGPKNGRARLTEAQIRIIKSEWIPRKVTIRQLRDKHAPGVSVQTVTQAVNGTNWKYLE